MGCNFMGNYMTREVLSKLVTTQKIGISPKSYTEIFGSGNRGLSHNFFFFHKIILNFLNNLLI